MSLIVAYKKDGVVYMGADTQISCGNYIIRHMNESSYKIKRMPNGILLGVCGRVIGEQFILRHKEWFNIPEGETFDKRYIVKNIVPQLSKVICELKERDTSRNASVTVLLAHKDKLFAITKTYTVYECNSFAIGSPDTCVRYAMAQIDDDNINESLLNALRLGAHFDSSVSAPFILIDTKNLEFKIEEN